MKKYEVSFAYASFDEDKDMYDGGPIEFTIEAESKEDAFENAYVGALETDGVDQIVDMTIVCKETGEKYTLDDVEAYLDEKEENRLKEFKYLKDKVAEQIPLKMQYSKIIEILEKGEKVDLSKMSRVGTEIFLI